MLRMHKEDQDGCGLTTSKVGCALILMNRSRTLLKTDIYGEPLSGQHVNLLHQKTTADDDDDVVVTSHIWFMLPCLRLRESELRAAKVRKAKCVR